jgi:hypothetical protein
MVRQEQGTDAMRLQKETVVILLVFKSLVCTVYSVWSRVDVYLTPVRQPFLAIYREKLFRFRVLWSNANFPFSKIYRQIYLAQGIFLHWRTDTLIIKHGICVLSYAVRLTNDMLTDKAASSVSRLKRSSRHVYRWDRAAITLPKEKKPLLKS